MRSPVLGPSADILPSSYPSSLFGTKPHGARENRDVFVAGMNHDGVTRSAVPLFF